MIVVLQSSSSGLKSSGAPPSSTGAPNELSCDQAGCHSDAVINSGSAIVQLDFSNQSVSFVPNQTYPITISISDSGHAVFGFEIVALDANGNNAGDFIIKDANRTQLITGVGVFSNRKYATYKVAGTTATSPGTNQWVLDWQAPSVINSDVSFYVSCVSANGDHTDGGDFTFTKSLTVSNDAPNSIANNFIKENEICVYPNPAKDFIVIKGNLPIGKKVELFDLQGRAVSNQLITNSTMEKIALPVVPLGIYLVIIKNGQNPFSQTIQIN